MFVPENYRLRHRVLEILIAKADSFGRAAVTEREVAVPLSELASQLKVDTKQLYKVLSPLIEDKTINVQDFGKGKVAHIKEHYDLAYYGEKHLTAGRKMVNESIYDVSKWAVPIVLVCMAFYSNYTATRDRRQSAAQIQRLQAEIAALKALPNPPTPIVIYPDSLSESRVDTVPHH